MKKFKSAITLLIVSVFCVSITNCTHYQLQIDFPSKTPSSHLIKDVPFIKQKPYYCGPACAEMVLSYHGIVKFNQDAIAKCDSFNPRGAHWSSKNLMIIIGMRTVQK